MLRRPAAAVARGSVARSPASCACRSPSEAKSCSSKSSRFSAREGGWSQLRPFAACSNRKSGGRMDNHSANDPGAAALRWHDEAPGLPPPSLQGGSRCGELDEEEVWRRREVSAPVASCTSSGIMDSHLDERCTLVSLPVTSGRPCTAAGADSRDGRLELCRCCSCQASRRASRKCSSDVPVAMLQAAETALRAPAQRQSVHAAVTVPAV